MKPSRYEHFHSSLRHEMSQLNRKVTNELWGRREGNHQTHGAKSCLYCYPGEITTYQEKLPSSQILIIRVPTRENKVMAKDKVRRRAQWLTTTLYPYVQIGNTNCVTIMYGFNIASNSMCVAAVKRYVRNPLASKCLYSDISLSIGLPITLNWVYKIPRELSDRYIYMLLSVFHLLWVLFIVNGDCFFISSSQTLIITQKLY